jgi:hypothetical protein
LYVARLSRADKVTVVRLLALLTVTEVALRLAALPTLSRCLGVSLRGSSTPAESEVPKCHDPWTQLTERERRQAHLLGQIVHWWPVGPGPCLRHALVLGHVLRRRDPVLRLGVTRAGEEIVAHAWVEIGGASLDRDARYALAELVSRPSGSA